MSEQNQLLHSNSRSFYPLHGRSVLAAVSSESSFAHLLPRTQLQFLFWMFFYCVLTGVGLLKLRKMGGAVAVLARYFVHCDLCIQLDKRGSGSNAMGASELWLCRRASRKSLHSCFAVGVNCAGDLACPFALAGPEGKEHGRTQWAQESI